MNRLTWIALGSLLVLYVINVAANAFYKAATHERVELLNERMASLARIDRDDPAIGLIRDLITTTDYTSLTSAAPIAIARRSALATYLVSHPHLSLGVAIDGEGLSEAATIGLLVRLNRHLRKHAISVGLAEPVVRIKLPAQASRDDMFNGVATAFEHEIDYFIALTDKTCRYVTQRPRQGEPERNRLYTFGTKGGTIVDATAFDDDLAERLLTNLANHLVGHREERRWLSADYAKHHRDVLRSRKVTGRAVRDLRRLRLPEKAERTVRVSVGLDSVTRADARDYLSEVDALFAAHGIRFAIHRLYEHRLRDEWNWPSEIRKMQERGDADTYVLLTSGDWISPRSGHVRGIASAFFGAIMVQTGTRTETIKRLMHEMGHLFQLPHTFIPGAVMYPSEKHIGLAWSHGSLRLLQENRQTATWHLAETYRQRFEIAIKLAPSMIRTGSGPDVPQPRDFDTGGDVWVECR